MQTQCPKCSTRYHVTASELRQALGQVKCGDCTTIFNALDFLADANGKPASLDPDTGKIVSKTANNETVEGTQPADEQQVSDDTGVYATSTAATNAAKTESDSAETTSAGNSEYYSDIKAAPISQRYYPLEPVAEDTPRSWIWSMAAVILITVLVSQIIIWQWPAIEPHANEITQLLNDEPANNGSNTVSSIPDNLGAADELAEKILVYTQQLNRQKNDQEVLLVTGSLLNISDEALSFPHLYIRMLDADGEALAERVFNPSEYNDSRTQADEPLPNGRPVALRLELAQVTTQPVSLQIQLLPGS